MVLNQKEKTVVHCLLKSDRYLTANEISEKSGFSKKTVYRTINELNDLLGNRAFIFSKIGKGYKIDYEKYILMKNKNEVTDEESCIEPADRRSFVFLKLLFKSPIKINLKDIYQEFFVSDDTIAKDLKGINDFATFHQVSLHRKGGKIWITGKESNIRDAINKVINSLNLVSFESFPSNINLNSTDSNYILYLINNLEKNIGFPINYPYNINVFLHIYILVNRIREGNVSDIYVDSQITTADQKLIETNQELFNLSQQTITELANYLNYSINKMEVFFLFQYLISSRIEILDDHISEKNSLEVNITQQLINGVDKRLKKNLNNEVLQKDLINHIIPMINRIHNDISVRNVLLPDILEEYPQLFQIVRIVCDQLGKEYNLSFISDDEVGFLTLYFAKAIEQNRKKLKIIIICTTGIGTSELLKTKVKKYFPNVRISALLSISEFKNHQIDYLDIDGILTTIHLTETNNLPCLIVNALFTSQDRKRMEDFIKRIEESENEKFNIK